MVSGFGVDPSADKTTGTSSSDIRKIFGGLYTPGIVNGAKVTTSATNMTYTVSSGVAAISTGTGEVVLTPIPSGTVTGAAAPGSGTRTDIVYAQQRYPSIEGDATVSLGVASTLPARAVALKKFTVSAGNTNTNQAVATGGIDFSIPYGANLGRLHYYQHTSTGINGALPNTLTRVGHGSFYLPTDRRVRFRVFACISASGASGFDNSKYCEYGFLPNQNGADFVLWSTSGLHQAWESVYHETTMVLPQGTNTVNLGLVRLIGPGTAMGHYGVGSDGFGRNGIEFSVEDVGPAV